MLKRVIYASMIDYPDNISAVLFFDKCNFNCEFCYNRQLEKLDGIDFEKEVLPKLLDRKDFVNHVILSGGECSIDEQAQNILDTLYNNGFIIGIHSNGYNPEFLKKNEGKISYVGMDIKNSINKYDNICGMKVDTNKVKESIDYILNTGIEHQFRTTVYPKYISKDDCVDMAKFLNDKGANEYVLQQYQDVESKYTPYTGIQLKEIQMECNKYIKTELKGII